MTLSSVKSVVRSPPRKFSHSSKNENCEEESFEDLLLKYKQIKLELESINKDEKIALKEQQSKEHESVSETTVEIPVKEESSTGDAVILEAPVEEKPPVKTFQAFELKPLRQKLKPIAEKKESIVEESSSAVITSDTETHEQGTVVLCQCRLSFFLVR